jgi:hypothetical protein
MAVNRAIAMLVEHMITCATLTQDSAGKRQHIDLINSFSAHYTFLLVFEKKSVDLVK